MENLCTVDSYVRSSHKPRMLKSETANASSPERQITMSCINQKGWIGLTHKITARVHDTPPET
eukprot:31781-Eustigmatos_ZCMA.PRE.1